MSTGPLRLTLHPDLPTDSQDEAMARLRESVVRIRPDRRASVRATETVLRALDRWRSASPWGDRPIDRLDVLAHGSPGRLALGDPFDAHGFLGLDTLARWQLLEAIENHVAPSGSIGLLGCSVGRASGLTPLRDGAMLAWALARSTGRQVGVPAFGLYADTFSAGCDGISPDDPSIAWFGPQTQCLPQPLDPGGPPPLHCKRPERLSSDHCAALNDWWASVRVATVVPATGYLSAALGETVDQALGGQPGVWFALSGWLGEALAQVTLRTAVGSVHAELLADGLHTAAQRMFLALRPPLDGWNGGRAGLVLVPFRQPP